MSSSQSNRVTTISSLTEHLNPNTTTQLNLSSTLPTKLYKIQSLQPFRYLTILNLSHNNIRKIQNFNHNLSQLKSVNLSFNKITVLQNIQHLVSLQELILGYNSINQISQRIVLNKRLNRLDLSYNMLNNINTITTLFTLNSLQSLCLQGNTVINQLNYRAFIKFAMPQLRQLDNKNINAYTYNNIIDAYNNIRHNNIRDAFNNNNQMTHTGQLTAQQQVIVLRDTLNKLLQERNYLAQQLQNSLGVNIMKGQSENDNNIDVNNNSPNPKISTSIMGKISLGQYLKSHYSVNNNIGNINKKQVNQQQQSMSVFSPIHYVNLKINTYKTNQKQYQQRPNKQSLPSQRNKMLQILQYWSVRMEEKLINKQKQLQGIKLYNQQIINKQKQLQGLKLYNQQRLKLNNSKQYAKIQYYDQNLQQQPQNDLFNYHQSSIKQQQHEYQHHQSINSHNILIDKINQTQNQIKSLIKQSQSINQLISQINQLSPQQQLYKYIMIKVLFGTHYHNVNENTESNINQNTENIKSKQTKQYSKDKAKDKLQSKSKRSQQLINYKQLKKLLFLQTGLLPITNSLIHIIFGQELSINQITQQKLNYLQQLTYQKSLLQMISSYKQKQKQLKKQRRQFEKQKQIYLSKLQKQTQQLCNKWEQFNLNKTQYQLQNNRKLRYQSKVIEQKQRQLQDKYKQLQTIQQQKLSRLNEHKVQLQNEIYLLQQKLQQLQVQHQRSSLQLQNYHSHLQTLQINKAQLHKSTQQLSLIKKQLFTKQNLLTQLQQRIKQLTLQEQIASERLNYLQRKCLQHMNQIQSKHQQQLQQIQKLNKLSQQQKHKLSQLTAINTNMKSLKQQQSTITKQIERSKQNLLLQQNKLNNLSQLQSHKRKSIQQLQLSIQQLKHQSLQLTDKNIQLQQIVIKKQQSIQMYMMKINENKKQLQTYTDMTKSMQSLIQRQAELKKSILQLQIQNGNLIDLKEQFVRQKKIGEYINITNTSNYGNNINITNSSNNNINSVYGKSSNDRW